MCLSGPNGNVGKSMFAQNIAHQGGDRRPHRAVHQRRPQAARTGSLRAGQRFHPAAPRAIHYARPQLLVIDEVGYLSYSRKPSRRHVVQRTGLAALSKQKHADPPPIVAFGEWNEVFPNAACVVSLVEPSSAQRRDRRHRGRFLSAQGSPRPRRCRARKRRGAPSRRPQCPNYICARLWSKSPSPGQPSRRLPSTRCSTNCARKSGPLPQLPTARSAGRAAAMRRRRRR